jgi:predicted component of viral defense system (DUF524 family)
MFKNELDINVETTRGIATLTLYGEFPDEQTIFNISDAIENGEAEIQIIEGCFYEYKVSKGFCLDTSEIITRSKTNKSSGRLNPNIYVGTLSIDVLNFDSEEKCGELKLEVQSVKTTYREDYRLMLREIAEKCIDLMFQHSSQVTQKFETDFSADSKTLYQRFAFIKAILESAEFNDSIHKILSAPVTNWKDIETSKDIRSAGRFSSSALRQIASATNRIELPCSHPLKTTIDSIPAKLNVYLKTETVDTAENRFIKHALISFRLLCNEFKNKLQDNSRLILEASLLEDKIEQYLSHSMFKDISPPYILPLNSPVIQRKEGYREILRIWLMFELAAKLVWHGGDDVYSGGKRDVAVLYEYWLYFKLLEIMKEVFNIDPLSTDKLIESTKDQLGLKLKQGKHLPISGIYDAGTRKLNVEFSYNRTFKGNNDYPAGGSWSRNLRPDYTLSIWPHGINKEQAEQEELMVHIHFDAKYKIEELKEIYGIDNVQTTIEEIEEDLNKEKIQQKKGTYKRTDILKMHTYRDAIRRTAGAYVLYPGSVSDHKKGFHEVLPGLGAFAISPSKTDSGKDELKIFLKEVVNHFINRASQREKISYRTYETYKNKKIGALRELLPEAYGTNRSLIPDDTNILIAYYKSVEHLKWILQNNLYNARAGSSRGSLRLDPKITGAEYLILHTKGEIITGTILKLKKRGPRIFSKSEMISKSYPEPGHDFYLIYDIEGKAEGEFKNFKWNISKLNGYTTSYGSPLPFSATLTEIMSKEVVIKIDL